MFVVEVGSVSRPLVWLRDVVAPAAGAAPTLVHRPVTLWLWFTVLFANFAEAVAEGRGKAQAASLRKMRKDTMARRLVGGTRGDRCRLAAAQGRPRRRRGRRDHPRRRRGRSRASPRSTSRPSPASPRRSSARAAATARPSPAARGCSPTASWSRITADPGESFLDRMIALVEGAARQKTPNEIALHILLVGLTIIFLFACVDARAARPLLERHRCPSPCSSRCWSA